MQSASEASYLKRFFGTPQNDKRIIRVYLIISQKTFIKQVLFPHDTSLTPQDI